jgi:hypothetical protein
LLPIKSDGVVNTNRFIFYYFQKWDKGVVFWNFRLYWLTIKIIWVTIMRKRKSTFVFCYF